MYYSAYMAKTRKSIILISEEIKKLLEKEGELSIRQISLKIGSQWRTVEKALMHMKSLEIVKERKGTETKRDERVWNGI
jgi:hypothetical protein